MPATRLVKRERAILVGLCLGRGDRLPLDEHLAELGRLAETAGAEVVGCLVQERGRTSPSTLVRSGKVEELKSLATKGKANLVVFDEDLSPAQVKNLEESLGLKVLDRSALILDIFARRARTREARTQVELAQLRYLLPRLTRQWGHLSRQEGGIGQRGVGETQLEIDRRMIRRRIARLVEELKDIVKERCERRKTRRSEPRVALIGYTNAGKSTIMRLLTGAEVFVEDRLFATLDPLVRRCERGGHPPLLVIDTVGFIRKLPHHLVASFRSTLEEAGEADLLVEVIDASSPAIEDHLRTTRETLADLGLADRPLLRLFNKIDLAPAGVLERLEGDYPGAILISALDPSQADRLEESVRAALGGPLVEETMSIPAGATGILTRLGGAIKVIQSAWVDGRLEVRFRARPSDLARMSQLLRAAAAAGGEETAS
ncbi:MAG TPA: GTPase HflX [Candidatus Polarisedimenticolia bacterium]|nr:GTPase HflX [Candidatus Polarisedimenticolia bacterium]